MQPSEPQGLIIPPSPNYTHFADLVRTPGERIRFHWFPGGNSVLINHVDSAGELIDESTLPKKQARTYWCWSIKAGWEPYGCVLHGTGGRT